MILDFNTIKFYLMKRCFLTGRVFCCGILMCCSCWAFADEHPSIVPHLNNGGVISVDVPDSLLHRLEFNVNEEVNGDDAKQSSPSSRQVSSIGYRVEIFADNNARTAKSQAQARRSRVSARLPQYATYMVFEAPYWRVRVGDFHSRQEAEVALSEIKKLFPAYGSDCRIVRSRVK